MPVVEETLGKSELKELLSGMLNSPGWRWYLTHNVFPEVQAKRKILLTDLTLDEKTRTAYIQYLVTMKKSLSGIYLEAGERVPPSIESMLS